MFVCENCKSESKVINSRPSGTNTIRRRECLGCHHRWSTYEVAGRVARFLIDVVGLSNDLAATSDRLQAICDDLSVDDMKGIMPRKEFAAKPESHDVG